VAGGARELPKNERSAITGYTPNVIRAGMKDEKASVMTEGDPRISDTSLREVQIGNAESEYISKSGRMRGSQRGSW
jgi:hypothetical protein